MKATLIRIYAASLSAMFGIVFVAQILGFLGVYYAFVAVPLSLITSVLAYLAYQRTGKNWLEALAPQETKSSVLRLTILFSSIFIALIVFVQRMIVWYLSSLGQSISVDFVGYHSIKVFQLFRDASVWNLAIPYGQYPFGYESLISFAMFFTQDIRIMGAIHAFIYVLLWLTIALLILRYAQLSVESSLLLGLAICFMPIIFPHILNMGKNDALLSLTVLMAILHAPVGDEHFHPLGLAFATMLSLATKATGLYILFYLWGLLMLNWFLRFRKKEWRDYMHPLTFIAVIVLMFPGGLWVIRNYLILGELFTSEIQSFFQTSIFANLDNPVLYESARSDDLAIALALIVVLALITLFHKRLQWQMTGTILVIALTFAVTPLSAFLTVNNLDYLDVQWRFVLHGVVLLWVIVIVLLAPLIRAIYAWIDHQKFASLMASIGLVLVSIGLLFAIGIEDLFRYDGDQWERILDPTLQENSIYDAMAELDGGTIYTENVSWLSQLIRNPALTINELRYPLGHADIYSTPEFDYIVFIPTITDEPSANFYSADEWEIIFEDETGIIYQPKTESLPD